jgi:hypothetical protein
VNKKILQALAEARVADGRTLLHARRFDAAYYLAGYAIECALKACIAKKTKRHDFPDKDFAIKTHTHKLEKLAELAGLMKQLHATAVSPRPRSGGQLGRGEGLVGGEPLRTGSATRGRRKATATLRAVEGRQGILSCIQQYW